ncbi:uncharacterized protein LOC131952108 [Physella acuta]|uniref:uncharacterized protein LOC131952108 n=1 Tax=Physella acuta TaxID=109671 RepID=UPI0027DD9F1C|nr:uncharacterized protein LOC131952108 [Physella acuta]
MKKIFFKENNESGFEKCNCMRIEEENGPSSKPNFIPVNEFTDADLPGPIRHSSLTQYIRQQEKLVVHLYVQRKNGISGTGFVWTCQDNIEVFDVCPAKQCRIRYPHKGYGGLLVYTNHSVVRDDVEAATCEVTFFYNSGCFIGVEDSSCSPVSEHVSTENLTASLSSENCSSAPDSKILNTAEKPANTLGTKPVRAYGLKLRECEENKDLVGLKIIYHDLELFDMVRGASKTNLLSKIPNQIKVNWKKYAIVISHPHGGSKVVSVGDLVALEEEDEDRPRRTTKYTASTCNGSSGAPVFTGSYSYRPFTHRGKYKGYNVSFSF